MTNSIPCPDCGQDMPEERLEYYPNCSVCTNASPHVGSTEGISKMGVVTIIPGDDPEEVRRLFNAGNCVIRRSNPKKTRERKKSQGGY